MAYEEESQSLGRRLCMRVLVWIAMTFLMAVFVVIVLVGLALDLVRAHDSPE
jgi:hypothetical protein